MHTTCKEIQNSVRLLSEEHDMERSLNYIYDFNLLVGENYVK